MPPLDSAKPATHGLNPLVLASVILGIVLFVYYPALSGPMLLDDFGSVTPSAISELSWSEIWRVATSNQSGMFGRPIPVISFALNLHFWPDNVFALKVVNLIIHLANSILVFVLSQIIFKRCLKGENINYATTLALVTTSIWALHPLQVSSVMYVVQRMTLLMTLFTLISVLLYVKFRTNSPATYTKTIFAVFSVLFFALLACLCKENGALTFLYIALLELTLLRNRTNRNPENGKFGISIICCYIPLFFAAIAAALMFDRLTSGYSSRNFDLLQRLLTEPGVIVMYLKMITIPNLNNMYFYYDSYPIVTNPDLTTLLNIAIILCLALVALMSIKRLPLLSIGIGLFLVSHVIESTFIPLELVFEHRNYLAILGLAIMIAWISLFAFKLKISPVIASLPVLAIVITLSTQTHSRSIEWSNGITLNTFALQSVPDSVRARTTLAVDLHNNKKPQESQDLLRDGLTRNPDSSVLGALLIHLLAANNQLTMEDTNTIKEFISNSTITKAIVFELTNIHRSVKADVVNLDSDTLRSLFEITINNPKKLLAPQSEAMLLGNYADLLMSLGEYQTAMKAIDSAIQLHASDRSYSALRSILTAKIDNSQQAEFE